MIVARGDTHPHHAFSVQGTHATPSRTYRPVLMR